MTSPTGENNFIRVRPSKAERENLWELLEMARNEDLGSGDLTGSLLSNEVQAEAKFIPRHQTWACGVDLLEATAAKYDGSIRTRVMVHDGEGVEAGQSMATWTGPARGVLAAERVALNFLQRLCGVATTTRQYVQAVVGTRAGIYDTRKTTPGWRELEKYAVRCGGGLNHRKGLWDAVLIKDNHLAIMAQAEGRDPIEAMALELARLRPYLGEHAFVELEVDTLDQFRRGLGLEVDIIMLDNMSVELMAEAVRLRDQAGLKRRVELEASGGITLANVREVALTGVERIAIGALTHSAQSADIGLDIHI